MFLAILLLRPALSVSLRLARMLMFLPVVRSDLCELMEEKKNGSLLWSVLLCKLQLWAECTFSSPPVFLHCWWLISSYHTGRYLPVFLNWRWDAGSWHEVLFTEGRESLLTLKISVNSRGGSWESYEKSQARCEHSKLGSTHFTQTLTSVVQEDLFLEVKSVYEHHELVAN